MVTIRGPERREKLAPAQGFGKAFSYALARWRGFGALFIGSSCNVAISTLALWNIPLFQRVYGWDIVEIGAVTGIFYFTAGPIGTALALWAQRKFADKHIAGSMRVLIQIGRASCRDRVCQYV